MRDAVVALSAKEPNATVMPRVSGRARRSGLLRWVCHLRCFTFFGNSIGQSLCAGCGAGSARFGRNRAILVLLELVALVDPDLDADGAVRKIRALVREVDVRAERLERDAALFDLLRAAHVRAAETSRNDDARAEHFADRHHLLDGLLEDAAKRHALLEAFRDHERDDGRIGLRLADFHDVELHRAAMLRRCLPDHVGDLLAELRGVLARAADHESRARGMDDDADFVSRAFDLGLGDIHAAQALAEKGADRLIYLEVFAEMRLVAGEPAAAPIADDAEAVGVGMYGVSHMKIMRALRARGSSCGGSASRGPWRAACSAPSCRPSRR